MQDSLTSLNQFKNKLFIFSFGLGLASTVAVFQPNTTVKEIGKSLLGFSIAGIVIGELVTSKAFTFYGKDAEELNKAINSKTKENNEVTRNLDKLTNELKTTKTQSEQLAVQLSKAIDTIKSRETELTADREKIYQLSAKLKDVGRFSTAEAHKIVRETYNRSLRKLEGHIEALMRNYEPIADIIVSKKNKRKCSIH